jgi:hypothetical protein
MKLHLLFVKLSAILHKKMLMHHIALIAAELKIPCQTRVAV